MRLSNLLKFVLFNTILFSIAWSQSSDHLDPTFGNNGKVTTSIQPEGWATDPLAVLQPDGKVIVGVSIGNKMVITRYLDDGIVDNNWGVNGFVTTTMPGSQSTAKITDMILLDNNILLVGGYRDTMSQNYVGIAPFIAKYKNGVLDPLFASDGIQTVFEDSLMTIWGLSVNNNRILGFGHAHTSGDTISIHALNIDDGSYDYSWGNNGYLKCKDETSNNLKLKISNGNKIIMSRQTRVSTFLPDGTYDLQFAQGGTITLPDIVASRPSFYPGNAKASGIPIALQANSKVLIAGIPDSNSPYFSDYGIVKRLDTLGNFDQTFGNNGIVEVDFGSGFLNHIIEMEVLSDDKFIVVGNAIDTTNGDAQYFALSKFNADGSIDYSFGNNGVVITSKFHQNENIDYVRDLLVQPDDKIILIGLTPLFNNTVNGLPLNTFSLARYNTNTMQEESDITDERINNGLKVYPNPANNILNVIFETEVSKLIQFEIYNMNGQKVHSESGNSKVANSMNISDLSKGVYVLKSISDEKIYHYKFTKK